jgi:two-component system, sensor histidine kinase
LPQRFVGGLQNIGLIAGVTMSDVIRSIQWQYSLEIEILRRTLAQAMAIMDAPLGNVQLVDWRKGELEIIAQFGFAREFLERFRCVRMEDGSACGRALLLRQPVVIADVECDTGFAPYRAIARNAGFRSVQSTPIASRSGAIFGMISTHWPTPGKPSAESMQELGTLASEAAGAIVRCRIVSA